VSAASAILAAGGGDVPIWAGIGLILLSAVAGSWAARARNRRRMRDSERE
jgi:hypothetical protein